MAAFKCDGCGAPIAPAEGQRAVTCTYCGAHNRMGTMATMAMRVSSSRDPVKLGRVVVAMIVAPIVMTFVIGVVVAVAIGMSASRAADEVANLPNLQGLEQLGGLQGSSTAGWDRRSPLTCGLNQTLRIDGDATLDTGPLVQGAINCRVVIEGANLSVANGTLIQGDAANMQITVRNSTLRGDVIVAGGISTTVEITDAHLHATRVAIQADGMANRVRVSGASTVEGGTTGITVSTSSSVNVSGTSRVSGQRGIESQGGEVVVDGGTVEGERAAIATGGHTSVQLRAGSTVQSAEGDGIHGEDHLRVQARDATIVAGRDAIAGGSHGNISLESGKVQGATALRFDRNLTLTLDGTEVVGGRSLGARANVTER